MTNKLFFTFVNKQKKAALSLFLIILASAGNLFAQEYLDGIIGNPVLENYKPKAKLKRDNGPLQLPFIDDFSYNSPLPSLDLWDDQFVFINNSYCKGPYSTGVATFDAVSTNGDHYGKASNQPFEADHLTSLPIDLSSADKNSLVISFFYQPQGTGNAPEKGDSLLLQIDTVSGNWKTIWAAPGIDYDTFKTDSIDFDQSINLGFKYVSIAINDPKYFKKNFRFRFMNYASLAASSTPSATINCDHWNIDFVYLNDNRSVGDNSFYDIAFTWRDATCLRSFTSVPWEHYEAAIQSENTRFKTRIRNNYANKPLTANLEFKIYDLNDGGTMITENTNTDVNYFELLEMALNMDYNENPIAYNSNLTSASYLFKAFLTPDDADIIKGNDTVYLTQVFDDYYAFDDGTAENAYGIDANFAMVAYKFSTFQSDWLTDFKMYFLKTNPLDAGATSFIASVWKTNNNGLPGELLVSKLVSRPAFDTALNRFVKVDLDTAIFIEAGEEFFIGWEQTSAARMNVGWDANRDYPNADLLYYNINGTWLETSFAGSLMLRPVFGDTLSSFSENTFQLTELNVYPNPASEFFTIQNLPSGYSQYICIYNTMGAMVKQFNTKQQEYNISDLTNGIYFVRIQSGKSVTSVKLIKN